MILSGGRIIDPANNIDAIGDARIEGGVIAEVRVGGEGGERSARVGVRQ